jgi:hypothetical protein
MEAEERLPLTLELANELAELPIKCMDQEYPNKLGQVLASSDNLGQPHELHPAFYGCFDWHSAVHGHWMLVKLLKSFPELEKADTIRQKLAINLTAENIEKEVAYFQQKQERSYERTYGWAWLLKLAEELDSWDDPQAKEWSANLQPLTDLIVKRYMDFLPKLLYPIRVGEHPNTGFGLSFAYDYAKTTGHAELQTLIEERAKTYFLTDADCPLNWEPSGFDFLSPCLEEADIMRRVLSKEAFKTWFDAFLPQLTKQDAVFSPGKVSDRSDGKLVHLDGVNLSRAWCLYSITEAIPEYTHLTNMANEHLNFTLKNIAEDDYAGGHWLASFAIYALTN